MLKLIFIILACINLTIHAQEKPDFTVSTLDDKEIALKTQYENGPLLINFWALWCEPCKVEMRALKSLYEKYSSKGFTIIAINQDSPKSISKVKSYVSSQKIRFPVVLDPNNQFLQKMNGQSIPYSLLFDKTGNVVYKHTGYIPGDEKELENEIQELLSDGM